MSYAIGNVSKRLTDRTLNLADSLKRSPETLERLKLPSGDSSSSSSSSETDKPSDNKALIVGALVLAGLAAVALRR